MFTMGNAKNDEEYFDRWAQHYSESVKTNLCPYYEWFVFKLSDETKKVCEALPGRDLYYVTFNLTTANCSCDEPSHGACRKNRLSSQNTLTATAS